MTVSFSDLRRRGLLLALSSPSGAGKSTLSRALLARDPLLSLSVSVTTRPPRPGEIDGVHYHFRTPHEAERMIEAGDLLEHATVFGNTYGTPRQPVEAALAAGQDVLFDVDWQGTQQLAQNVGDDLVRVFILPPSLPELERRLHRRAQDSAEVVAARMDKACDEMSHWSEYDYIVVNEDVDQSIARMEAILRAERLKRKRWIGLDAFVNDMRRDGQERPPARPIPRNATGSPTTPPSLGPTAHSKPAKPRSPLSPSPRAD